MSVWLCVSVCMCVCMSVCIQYACKYVGIVLEISYSNLVYEFVRKSGVVYKLHRASFAQGWPKVLLNGNCSSVSQVLP